jgi:putative peptidoglycan lipid II flippase
VLFERGAFTESDASRAARMIACYASGVWAYCAIPVLVRGFYAAGDRISPARLGLAAVALNLALNLTLVWPLAELGLAVATSISAAVQVALLALIFSRDISALDWRSLAATIARGAVAVATMAGAVLAVSSMFGLNPESTRTQQAIHLAVAIGAGIAAYLAAAALLRMPELSWLARPAKSSIEDHLPRS